MMSLVNSDIVSASLCVRSQFPDMRFHIVISVKILVLVDGCHQFGIIIFFRLDGKGSRYHQTLVPLCQMSWDHIPEDENINLQTTVSVSPPHLHLDLPNVCIQGL